MATTQSTLVALFRNRSDAESAASDLRANGFSNDDVYVGSYSDATSTGTGRTWSATHHREGGIKGWFKSLFGSDEDTEDYTQYENAASQGNVIVSVQADDARVDRVAQILQSHNPIDIDESVGTSTTNARTAPVTGANPAIGTGASTTARTRSETGTGSSAAKRDAQNVPEAIPVVREDLRVGKRSVLRGGVRVYSRVIEQPVEENVRLREERVRVERQPADRPAQAGDLRAGGEQVYEVAEYAEEPVVQKQARVVEEVRVGKDVSERTETIRDTVRRQEVQVENLGQGGATGNYSDDFRRDFQANYANGGGRFEDYEPAYTYGYEAANDARYRGRSWQDVESDLRTDYGGRYPNSAWDRMKNAVRYGWDRVTGQARGAAAGGRTSTTHGD